MVWQPVALPPQRLAGWICRRWVAFKAARRRVCMGLRVAALLRQRRSLGLICPWQVGLQTLRRLVSLEWRAVALLV